MGGVTLKVVGFLKFYLIITALLFVGFGFCEVEPIEKLLLLFLLTLVSPSLFRFYLGLRGVRKGDLVLVSTRGDEGGISIFQRLPAIALEKGKKDDIIQVELGPSRFEGKITSCGGIISPPGVRIFHATGAGEIF